MKRFILIFIAATMFSSCTSKTKDKQEINTLTKSEIADGWQLLFNGKDLANWKIYNGGEVAGWKIEDGILYNSGVGSDHGGDIITKAQFENFDLRLEWKIAPQSNSGVFFNVVEGVAPALYQSGPEYQLMDDRSWSGPLKKEQMSAANYDMHAPVGAEVKPLDEWNETRIVVNNGKVQHWLNGKKVVEYQLWSDDWNARKAASKWADEPYYGAAKKGHIGLQDHGGLTMFRNIKIKEL